MTDITDKIMANLDKRLKTPEEVKDPDFVIICDGGSLNNQADKIGYGSYIIGIPKRNFQSAIKRMEYGPGVSNQEAEYMIAIDALGVLEDIISAEGGRCKDYTVEIRTDSQLVIGHMSKGWKLNASNLRTWYHELKGKLDEYKGFLFTKVPEQQMKQIVGH